MLLASDGIVMAKATGDARRLLLSRMVVEQRLRPQDPLATKEGAFAKAATDLLLDEAPVPVATAVDLLTA